MNFEFSSPLHFQVQEGFQCQRQKCAIHTGMVLNLLSSLECEVHVVHEWALV